MSFFTPSNFYLALQINGLLNYCLLVTFNTLTFIPMDVGLASVEKKNISWGSIQNLI